MHQKAMSADVLHITLECLDSHLCIVNRAVKWVLSRHSITKVTIFL